MRETFFKLFKDGLIYRGKRLVNWDTFLQTSISDDEIYHETVKTFCGISNIQSRAQGPNNGGADDPPGDDARGHRRGGAFARMRAGTNSSAKLSACR